MKEFEAEGFLYTLILIDGIPTIMRAAVDIGKLSGIKVML